MTNPDPTRYRVLREYTGPAQTPAPRGGLVGYVDGAGPALYLACTDREGVAAAIPAGTPLARGDAGGTPTLAAVGADPALWVWRLEPMTYTRPLTWVDLYDLILEVDGAGILDTRTYPDDAERAAAVRSFVTDAMRRLEGDAPPLDGPAYSAAHAFVPTPDGGRACDRCATPANSPDALRPCPVLSTEGN